MKILAESFAKNAISGKNQGFVMSLRDSVSEKKVPKGTILKIRPYGTKHIAKIEKSSGEPEKAIFNPIFTRKTGCPYGTESCPFRDTFVPIYSLKGIIKGGALRPPPISLKEFRMPARAQNSSEKP